MKREELLDAIGLLDGDLIVEAEEMPARRKRPLWQAATAAAAALVMCAGLYAMQPAGTAAPEAAQGTDGALRDVHSMIADGVGEDYEYRTDEFKSSSLADKVPGVETSGVFEPVFRTERGRYLLVGEELPLKSKLPEDARYLGELVETDYDKPAYPSVGTKELVGCPVWESEDGEYLYIQSPAGGWLQATRSK